MLRKRIAILVLILTAVGMGAMLIRPVINRKLVQQEQQRSTGRRVDEVTSIACAIERYRAAHGRLPSATELSESAPNLGLLMNREDVQVALLPSNYVAREIELCLDCNRSWSVVDGRWETWTSDTPEGALRSGRSAIATARSTNRRPN